MPPPFSASFHCKPILSLKSASSHPIPQNWLIVGDICFDSPSLDGQNRLRVNAESSFPWCFDSSCSFLTKQVPWGLFFSAFFSVLLRVFRGFWRVKNPWCFGWFSLFFTQTPRKGRSGYRRIATESYRRDAGRSRALALTSPPKTQKLVLIDPAFVALRIESRDWRPFVYSVRSAWIAEWLARVVCVHQMLAIGDWRFCPSKMGKILITFWHMQDKQVLTFFFWYPEKDSVASRRFCERWRQSMRWRDEVTAMKAMKIHHFIALFFFSTLILHSLVFGQKPRHWV